MFGERQRIYVNLKTYRLWFELKECGIKGLSTNDIFMWQHHPAKPRTVELTQNNSLWLGKMCVAIKHFVQICYAVGCLSLKNKEL